VTKPNRYWSPKRGEGETAAWLKAHVNHQGDDCLIWPFSRNENGYGMLGYLGKTHWAHRLMCEFAHGPAPAPKMQVAHACGLGHTGCVNPRHLSWKTRSENRADCKIHGTNLRSQRGNKGRLSPQQVLEIRGKLGKVRQIDIAAEYGISKQAVSSINTGRMYTGTSKVNHWSEADDAKLREAIGRQYTARQKAEYLGRSMGAVRAREVRLGLR